VESFTIAASPVLIVDPAGMDYCRQSAIMPARPGRLPRRHAAEEPRARMHKAAAGTGADAK